MIKVSVIITTHNYGRYLKKCIDSALNQTTQDFEIIIVDDASTDNTADVLREYENNEKIMIIKNEKNLGLVVSFDKGIQSSNGKYIIRLDADDYFDDNALLVLSNFLDSNPGIGLVYSDYFRVGDDGRVLEYVRGPKIGEEVKMMDMPANGASSLFRRTCYDSIGGYNKSIKFQDNHDLWIKMIDKYKVANINLPLFYYRKHEISMSCDKNQHKKLQTRRLIKEDFVKNNNKNKGLKVLGIIPARAKFDIFEKLPLRSLAGKPIMSYTIEQAKKSKYINKLVVATENEEIAEAAKKYGVDVVMRPPEMADSSMLIEHTIVHVLDKLKATGYVPDLVVMLHVNSPFKTCENIDEAVNTLIIYKADSVIPVCDDNKLHYRHGTNGMRPLFKKRLMRRERESLYEENGTIYVTKREVITKDSMLGKRVSHVMMTPTESIRIDSKFNLWLVEQMIKSRCMNEDDFS